MRKSHRRKEKIEINKVNLIVYSMQFALNLKMPVLCLQVGFVGK